MRKAPGAMRKTLGAMRKAPAVLAMIVGVAAFVAPANAAARCKPSHHVLARERGRAVMWATVTRHGHRVTDRLYVCLSPQGKARLVAKEPGSAYPSVTHLQVAGQFVGFFLTASTPFYVGPYKSSLTGSDLYVFDTKSRRVDLRDQVACQGPTCALVPEMTNYLLASNGWVAELYALQNASGKSNVRELVATYAPGATGTTRESAALDFDSTISGLGMSGDVLSWTGDLSGGSSAVLDPSLIASSSAQAVSACQLLTTTDVSRVLGPATVYPSSSGCEYASNSGPSTLSVSFKAGLSSQQVNSDRNAFQNNNANFSPVFGYSYTYAMYIGRGASSGVSDEQLMLFSPNNGSELSLELTTPTGNADEQLPWLANVAFDHLFAVPIQRSS